MGFFSVLFCCCTGRRRSYDDTFVEYSYVPSGQPVKEESKMVDEPTKESVCDTTAPLKEITPPPQYSSDTSKTVQKKSNESSTNNKRVAGMEMEPEGQSDLNHATGNGEIFPAHLNTLSKIETVLSSAPLKAGPSKIKKEQDEIKPRVIKPLPRRCEDLTFSSKRPGADVPLPPDVYAEQKTMPKECQKSIKKESSEPYLSKTVEILPKPSTPSAPFIFLAGTSAPVEPSKQRFLPSPSTSPLVPAPKEPTALSTTLPAPTAVYGLTSTQIGIITPPTPQCTPKKPTTTTTTTTTTTPTKPPRGTYCPQCASPNTIHKTAAQNLNHGRPYRKCSNTSCRAWNGFADQRGLTPGLYCDCNPPSLLRLVAKNATDKRCRREAFYSCQYKACGVWRECVEEDGVVRLFGQGEIEEMVRCGGI